MSDVFSLLSEVFALPDIYLFATESLGAIYLWVISRRRQAERVRVSERADQKYIWGGSVPLAELVIMFAGLTRLTWSCKSAMMLIIQSNLSWITSNIMFLTVWAGPYIHFIIYDPDLLQISHIPGGRQGLAHRRGGEGGRPGGPRGLQDYLRPLEHTGERREGEEDVSRARGGRQEGARLVQTREHAARLSPRVRLQNVQSMPSKNSLETCCKIFNLNHTLKIPISDGSFHSISFVSVH